MNSEKDLLSLSQSSLATLTNMQRMKLNQNAAAIGATFNAQRTNY